MKKLILLSAIFMAVYAINAFAFTPWFSGTALPTPTSPTSCIKNSPNNPPSPVNFFLGENLSAALDPADPNNAAVIALNGGSNQIRFSEICFNAELVETACGDAYVPTTPVNGVYAGQFSVNEVNALSGTTIPWVCFDPGTPLSGAFYTLPVPPPYSYVTSIFSSPSISASIVNGILYAGSSPGFGNAISFIYAIGPVPLATSALAPPVSCAVNTFCSIAPVAVSCPGTYQVIALNSFNQARAASVAC